MNISKKLSAVMIAIVLMVGMIAGIFIAQNNTGSAHANVNNASSLFMVDKETLQELYSGFFGRPIDDGAKFHIGKDLKRVLHDLNNSQERQYYAALFKAVKSYEEAVRAPGILTDEDKKRYLDAIDSALATLLAWVQTLPEQAICKSIVGPEQAREAIKAAYEKMSPRAKEAAEHGIFNALNKIGPPHVLPLPGKRCLVISPVVSPSNPPSVRPSPSVSPSVTPTGTPVPTVTVTPTPAASNI